MCGRLTARLGSPSLRFARAYSQQQQPLQLPQHGPSVQPHAQVHFGSSQQQAVSDGLVIGAP
jgi:hypothetical protein